jgi:predicted MFS family arabinose efflux permease
MTERVVGYRDVFASGEYRALFSANTLSILGDHLTVVGATFLVYAQTGSPALAAGSFSLPLLAWVVGGPLLSGYADRFPRRRVMIGCDLARAGALPILALPGLPVWALMPLLFMVNLLRPPFQASRAALMPDILHGDRYFVANGLDNVVYQCGHVVGFAAGGALVAAVSVRGALLLDAATFLTSGLLVRVGVRYRPVRPGSGDGSGPRRFAEGVAVVFTDRRLRFYVLLFWVPSAFTYGFEGLASPLAGRYGGGPMTGGLLLAAAPLGLTIGAVVLTRLCPPATRIRLLAPMALLSCAALVTLRLPAPPWLVLVVFTAAGFGSAYAVPLNSLFGQTVPAQYRGRAFGMAVTGVMVLQGGAMALAGLASQWWAPTTVIATSGMLGVVAVSAVLWIAPARARLQDPNNVSRHNGEPVLATQTSPGPS